MGEREVSGVNFQVSCLKDEWVVVLFTRFRRSRGGGFVNHSGHAVLGACGTYIWMSLHRLVDVGR